METETYKNAKMILERFDPESKKQNVSFQFLSYSLIIFASNLLLNHILDMSCCFVSRNWNPLQSDPS